MSNVDEKYFHVSNWGRNVQFATKYGMQLMEDKGNMRVKNITIVDTFTPSWKLFETTLCFHTNMFFAKQRFCSVYFDFDVCSPWS